ncbi:MAG TPA: L-2-hydroxyglutarate oxidase [Dermatophilaceae bacterium]|nr:L-2-hydroxyglutarate oxidase [Dermatophilaceae bacterium]
MRAQRVVVVGGGIVGLAVADRVAARTGTAVTVLEKEQGWARHQTGRNSGVVHSGLYYVPGSLKARMCRAGAESLADFARTEGVPFHRSGKLVVATSEKELPGLARWRDRGRANGLEVVELDRAAVAELEPDVAAVAALRVPATGVIDYGAVCTALARRLARHGAALEHGTEVLSAHRSGRELVVTTTRGEVTADLVVNCAGLQADLVARALGHRPSVRIVPFRGEYVTLREDARHLVRGLVYPVPDPELPFLGVHLTRGVDGVVHAGPNAVLALAREGYDWRTVSPAELADTLGYPGFWRLARREYRSGLTEMRCSLSRRRFAESVRRLVPALTPDDLVPAPAGVRAQAVARDGSLLDDFLIEHDAGVVHVLNAPSPAATAALEIARHIETMLPLRDRTP